MASIKAILAWLKAKWVQLKDWALQPRVFLLGFFWCLLLPLGIILVVDGEWIKSYLKFWLNEQSVISPIVSLFAFFVATFGIFLAGRRNDTTERGQVIERFTRAVEQLGHEEQAVRIGGLHGLERIAEISLEERSQAFSVLDGFVRSQMAKSSQKPSMPHSAKVDVETAIKILARIVKPEERKDKK